MPTLPLPVSTSCQPNPCAPGGQCSPRSARTALVKRAPRRGAPLAGRITGSTYDHVPL
jgi:hypothetical protein